MAKKSAPVAKIVETAPETETEDSTMTQGYIETAPDTFADTSAVPAPATRTRKPRAPRDSALTVDWSEGMEQELVDLRMKTGDIGPSAFATQVNALTDNPDSAFYGHAKVFDHQKVKSRLSRIAAQLTKAGHGTLAENLAFARQRKNRTIDVEGLVKLIKGYVGDAS